MPQIGYGVYQVDPTECERCVSDALRTGYRMIDTAQAYHNEEGVGAAVAKSGIPRDKLFLVSKIWISNYSYDKAMSSIDGSLRKLGTDYIDLIMAWAPLAEGRNGFFTNPVLENIGRRYGKSVAQVAQRWLVQRGVIIIPKSTHVERMKQNLDILDFTLSDEDMAAIDALDTGKSLFFDHHSAEAARMFMGWRGLV